MPGPMYSAFLKDKSLWCLLSSESPGSQRRVTVCWHILGSLPTHFYFLKNSFLGFPEIQVIRANISKLSKGSFLSNERADTFGRSEKSRRFLPIITSFVFAQNSLIIFETSNLEVIWLCELCKHRPLVTSRLEIRSFAAGPSLETGSPARGASFPPSRRNINSYRGHGERSVTFHL